METMRYRFLLIVILTVMISLAPVYDVYSDDTLVVDDEVIALQHIYSVFNNEIDLTRYRGQQLNTPPIQDATMSVMDIRRNWENWSPEFRKVAGQYFIKKQVSPVDRRLRKTAGLSAGKAANGVHVLPNWVETANFSIEWGNSINNNDSGKDSIRIVNCSKRLLGSPCDGIPDVVDNWADYFEEVWEKEIGGLGYIEPAGTQSYLYDIYIANTGDAITGNDDDQTPSLSFNYLGITITYCDYESLNSICKNNISDASSYIIVNGDRQNTDIMKITAAHEFFHAIQFSYPSIDSWFSNGNRWWIESTATWMEEVVYDEINSYYSRVKSWLKNPSLSLKYAGNTYTTHEYGDVLFVIFLTDIYLHDRELVKYVWERKEGGINTIDNVLIDRYHSSFESAFRDFVALNAVADIGELKGGYEEGSQYGRASVTRKHYNYPIPYFEISGEDAPQELGSNYIQFIPPDVYDNKIVIEFDGSDNINWAVMMVKVRSNGTGFDHEEMILEPNQKYGCYAVEGFGSSYSEVFLAPAILIDHTLSDTAPYYYKASINGACTENATAHLFQSGDQSDAEKVNNRRCFIATAAFGSPESTAVRILRDFRDKYLLPYRIGHRFVNFYYAVSPPIAEFIEGHPPTSFIVRILLFPAVAIAFLLTTTTLWPNIALIIIISLIWLMPGRSNC